MSGFPAFLLPVASLAALLLLAAVLVAWLVASRRRSREILDLVGAVERLRAGLPAEGAEIGPDSPLAIVSDAVRRLDQDLAQRRAAFEDADSRLRALTEAAPGIAVLGTDADGAITRWNPEAESLLGWEVSEISGRPAAALFGEAAWRDLLAMLARRTARQHGLATDSVLLHRDGGPVPVELHVRPLRDEAGRLKGFLAAARDARVRVDLERRLAEAEARQRDLFESVPQGVAVTRDGAVVFANTAFGRLVRHEPSGLLGSSFSDWVATSDVLEVRERLAEVESGRSRGADLRFRSRTAESSGPAILEGRATRTEFGGAAAALVVLSDAVERAAIAGDLRRSLEQLDAILDALPEGIVALADGREGSVVEFVNGAFLERFGLTSDEVLGVREDALLRRLRQAGAGSDDVAAFFAASRGSGLRDVVTFAAREPVDLELVALPRRGPGGQAIGRVVVVRPCHGVEVRNPSAGSLGTDREALERADRRIEEANRDLESRARDLERAHRERVRLDEMKSQLLANVAHELQTPLVSIRGYTEMILRGRLGPVTDEQRKGLDLSLRNVDRLIGMIDGLLEFSRMEREVGELRPTVFRVADALEECSKVLAPRIEEKNLRWTVRLEDPELGIHADREKIQQVLLNVVGNAVKFNRDGGAVDIDVRRRPDGFAVVRVRDTGIGIAKEDVDRIFDRFYRAPETPEGQPGTGLGLSIARNLLRLHGCTIRADSEAGRGSTFTFTLPLPGVGAEQDDVPPPGEATPGAAEESPGSDAPGGDRRRLRIIRPGGR